MNGEATIHSCPDDASSSDANDRTRLLAVFHDDTLKRMCKEDKKIIDLTFDELSAYRLLESDEGIPLFSDVLRRIDGKVPLLIEIKTDGNVVNTARAVDEATKDYKGAFAVQSFDPRAPYYFKKHRREVPRGILSTKHKAKASGKSPIITLVMTNLLCNFLVRPDFIAYNHKYSKKLAEVYGCANEVAGEFCSFNLNQTIWKNLSFFDEVVLSEPLKMRSTTMITFVEKGKKAVARFEYKKDKKAKA